MLNTIHDLINKKGFEYTKKLLSEELVISEKIDTYRILFEKKDGKLKFYKKDNTEINLIERVLTNLWEDAIIELSIILDKSELLEGYRYGLAYSPVTKPLRLEYKKIPKYILTDIILKENNRVKDILDYTEVKKWSEELKLGRPPVIFEGKLSEEAIDLLFEYDKKTTEKSLEEILGNMYSGENIIKGVIIKSKDKLIQVNSFEYDILNESDNNKEQTRDFYDITMISISNFIETYKLPMKKFTEDKDKSYLSTVSEIFNDYITNNRVDEKLDHQFLEPPTFGYLGDLNLLLLENKKTISILEKGNKVHESIFRIMLSLFRKYKTNTSNLLDDEILEKLNVFTYLMNQSLGIDLGNVPEINKVTNILNESENIVVKTYNKKTDNNDITTMSIISSIQNAFTTKAKSIKAGKIKSVIYLIDSNPITSEHINNIEKIYETYKIPIVLGTVLTDEKLDGNSFYISDDLKKAQIESIYNTHSDKIIGIFFLEDWSLKDIFEFCRPDYEPMVIITEPGAKSEIILQLFFEEEVMGKRLGVNDNFNIGEMENTTHNLLFRSIEDNDATKFKELTPAVIWNFYDKIFSEYNEWAGIVPKQFELNKFN